MAKAARSGRKRAASKASRPEPEAPKRARAPDGRRGILVRATGSLKGVEADRARSGNHAAGRDDLGDQRLSPEEREAPARLIWPRGTTQVIFHRRVSSLAIGWHSMSSACA